MFKMAPSLQDIGVKIITNSDVKRPTTCYDLLYDTIVTANSGMLLI